ncbi:hypothetical protein ALC60_04584 [Trachymyrmex zeteki]|uniref:Uncharacterized protein n=1 Tax=Mycetomoellerius zeteki TaxID=64791 RepID=A0A151X807_9HYME|nr:hypothetical protein ALC60_04584 [Trachymyrmex zeteki]
MLLLISVCYTCSIMGIYRIKKFVCVDYEEFDNKLSSLSLNLLLGFQGNTIYFNEVNTCLTYVITSDHKVTVLHRLGEHAAFSRATHSIQSRFKFLILNGNIIQEHAVLHSNKQIRLLTSCSYREAKPSPNPIAINVRLVCTHKAVGGTAL